MTTPKSAYGRMRRHIEQYGIIPKKAKMILRVATSIVDKIPKRGDTTLQKVLKVMSIADAVEGVYQNASKKTEMSEVVARLGMKSITSSVFVSMFFDTRIHEEFELQRYVLDGNLVVEAASPIHGKLIFVERYEKQYSPTFYHSQNFDFEKVLEKTWELYDNRLQFEITWDKSTYTTFSTVANPLYGLEASRMEKMVTRHRRYALDGHSRAYMFYGAPGTGKTSFALAFADRVGNHIMRIDARSFSRMSLSDIMFIIEALKPDFIMVDDVDKADPTQSLPVILNILQELKVNKTKTSLLLTANTVAQFDLGLLRPGRVDTWLTFDPPAADDRRNIINGYLSDSNTVIDQSVIEELVALTDDLTQDYLREAAQRLKYEDIEDVFSMIIYMRMLLKKPVIDTKKRIDTEKKDVVIETSSMTNGKNTASC